MSKEVLTLKQEQPCYQWLATSLDVGGVKPWFVADW